jgi:hypothetical protein
MSEPKRMELEYNTERGNLKLSEYGRNIQKMINHAIAEPDREQRNIIARAIIAVMGQLNPHLRDVTDFTHKLWDHLFIISDFKLDVDSPYPRPSKETLTQSPEKISYPRRDIKFVHYGKNLELMIDKAASMQDGPERDALIEIIANLMKKFYINFNRDNVTDEIIFEQLGKLSGGKIKPENLQLSQVQEIINRGNMTGSGKKKKNGSKQSGSKTMKKKY